MREITEEKIEKYLEVTSAALLLARQNINPKRTEHAADAIDMVERYISDSLHFKEKGDFVNCFAALNYAHGWLDCGARTGLFDVSDSTLFTVDE